MINQKSCGAIIFYKDKEIKYLLLEYKNWWDFPRGLIEENETEEQAAIRELKEETGVENPEFIQGFKENINFFFKVQSELVRKEIVYFLVKVNNLDIKISWEHKSYAWLTYEEALEKLNFKKSKDILKKANNTVINSLINY